MIKTIKDLVRLSKLYEKIDYSKHHLFPRDKIDISFFSSQKKHLEKIEKEMESIFFNIHYLGHYSLPFVFLDCLKYTMEDKNFNVDFFIEDDSRCNNLRLLLLTNSLYRDISIYDKLVSDSNEDIRAYVVSRCSFDKLPTFFKDKNKTIRLRAYERIGPVTGYKQSLKDKSKAVREWGIVYAPIYDENISNMYNERSAHNYSILIEKVDKTKLPFFLSPSFLNSKSVGQYVKIKIKQEIKKRMR